MNVTFREDSRHRLSSVFAEGHVELPETSSDEFSLVCAAVSGILQAARLGLEAHVKVPLDATQNSGTLSLRWPSSCSEDERDQAIVDTARLAVAQIASQYPRHVTCLLETEA
jgi:uncharacterized protein YsxB (DUF464 family)